MKIPSLDGLRAVSILLVVVSHVANGSDWPNNAFRTVLGNGGLGVNVFFVISGFLITTLLLREFSLTGGINLRQFYIRRAFRILPPYYVYLAAIAWLGAAGIFSLPPHALTRATFFLWDYWPAPDAWYLEHMWSLAVEEQFYLVWPLLLVWALHRKRPRLAVGIALAVILLSPIIRVGTYYLAPEFLRTHLHFMFHTRADSLMVGALCALTQNSRYFEQAYQSVARYAWVAALFALVGSPLLTRAYGGAYVYLIGYTVEGASIALTMVWLIRNPESILGRILNSRAAVQIGVMSYSIYIWQTIFLYPGKLSFPGALPFSLLLIAICASFSYYMVERPSLHLRDRLTKRAAKKLQLQ